MLQELSQARRRPRSLLRHSRGALVIVFLPLFQVLEVAEVLVVHLQVVAAQEAGEEAEAEVLRKNVRCGILYTL